MLMIIWFAQSYVRSAACNYSERMNSGYFAAWSGARGISEQQQQQQQQAGCTHFGLTAAPPVLVAASTASTTICSSSGQLGGAVQQQHSQSWTVPDLYDHSSLLDCARCINQGIGHYKTFMGGGQGQGSVNHIMDGELMQELHYNIEDEDDMCLGMEMKMMKKRKLTSEQARQLEASFEADKKLEAEKKQRLAEQLGLQPRQVAVWFQNRRARSKTKQLEMDFLTLKAEYDRVVAQRRSLQAEIARLSAELQGRSSDTKNNTCSQDSTSSINSSNGDMVSESAVVHVKMASPIVDREGLTSNFSQQHMENGKDGNPRTQDPNLHSFDWESYDNGLWVFD